MQILAIWRLKPLDNSFQELMDDLTHIFGQKFKYTTGFEGIAQGIVIDDNGAIYANGDYRRKSDMHPGGY